MQTALKYAHFPGKIVIVGFGSVAQAILPLLFRHIDVRPEQLKIISADENGCEIAQAFGTDFMVRRLTEKSHLRILEPLLHPGDFLLNLSVDVSSQALVALCARCGALYLDTCIEPWEGGYCDVSLPVSRRSNYALREGVLALRDRHRHGPTAVLTQGANPGLASLFVKQALLDMAADSHLGPGRPSRYEDWAELARRLNIRTIHIAERDSQTTDRRKQHDEFVNTWSVDGFVGEALQPAELGWGSHERHWPADAERHDFGCDAAIYLKRPGAATRVRSWTPREGPYHGFLITHGESISIADHLTLREHGRVTYRPTVHYAYHPCDDAVLSLHQLAGRNWRLPDRKRILRDEITGGMDELGVLLMGNDKGVYWYGSRLTIDEVRRLAPHNNATSLQVAAGILGGIVWSLRNPEAGIVEPDDIDYAIVLDIAKPYLGEVVGVYGDWNPLQNRSRLFDDDLDAEDPWQFKNFRIS